MAALTKNRDIQEMSLGGKTMVDPVTAAVHIFKGAMVALDGSGNATPATAGASGRVRGLASHQVDNSTGAAGDLSVETKRGAFKLAQTGLTRADIGADVKVTDDQTVGGAGTLVAGKLLQLEGNFAWIEIS